VPVPPRHLLEQMMRDIQRNTCTATQRRNVSYLLRGKPKVPLWMNTSPNIARVIKSRRMRWAGHVARMVARRGVCRVLVGKPEGNHLGDQGVDGRIILRWIFRKWDVGMWTGSSWLRIGTGGRQW